MNALKSTIRLYKNLHIPRKIKRCLRCTKYILYFDNASTFMILFYIMITHAFIASHQGLGDFLLCNGLYRSVASNHEVTVLPVRNMYFDSVKRMLGDLENFKVISFPNHLTVNIIEMYLYLLPNKQFNKVRLGNFGSNFMINKMKFDESFYFQANIDFAARWSKFGYKKNEHLEDDLFKSYHVEPQNYIFLHEDKRRGFTIDRNLIPNDLKVVCPNPNLRAYNFFDYTKLIRNARQIHCIESSFAAFIESLDNIKCDKFAHRYARPEANQNPQSEFTYKTMWNIINK